MKAKAEKQTVTAYVTKFAITKGILQVQGSLSNNGEMLTWRTDGAHFNQYAHKGDFYLTEAEAKARVKVVVGKKTAALTKQLQRLETYEAPVVEVKCEPSC